LPIRCDAEVLAVINEILKDLELDFEIRINNKKILDNMIKSILGEDCDLSGVLRIIDKMDKISHEDFCDQLVKMGISQDNLQKMLDFFNIIDNNENVIAQLSSMTVSDGFALGVSELSELYEGMQAFGIEPRNIKVDLKLARGLTYYTGNIFETKLRGVGFESSISGGGRYDNLTSLFSKKRYPGVGVTLGVTRLIPILFEKGIRKPLKRRGKG
jgi:histidyl-tRNA synthetase